MQMGRVGRADHIISLSSMGSSKSGLMRTKDREERELSTYNQPIKNQNPS